MKTPQSTFLYSLMALGLTASLASSCSKKSDSHDDAPAAKPVVETYVTSSKLDGSVMKIGYKSNLKDAKFKCQTEVDGKAGDWTDCTADGASVDTSTGSSFIFRVKAVSADGTESQDVREIAFNGKGGGALQSDLVTAILNKADVGSVYAKSTLKLEFGIQGGAVPIDSVRFECKRENETDFRRCNDTDTQSYDFGALIGDSSYSLAVRGVVRDTNEVAQEASVSFKAQAPSIVQGADALRAAKTGTLTLTADATATAGKTLMCSLDSATAVACPTGSIPVNLDQMAAGSHTLKIEARDAQNALAGSEVINFCAQSCTTVGATAAPIIQAFQIGSFYQFLLSNDMHMTEYATTKTYNGALSFFRVSALSDPYYLGIYKCNADWDQQTSAPSPSGQMYDYCHSTPTRDIYKWLTDNRIANNHLEVATNGDLVNQYNFDRISINVFDQDYEYMLGRSRFEQLCMNRRGTIQVQKNIRFIDRNFWGENVKSDFYMCVTSISGTGAGLPSSNDQWWVGAFFITSETLNLPLYECYNNDYAADIKNNVAGYGDYKPQFCGTFTNPHLLEVNFMTKTPYRTAADFAQYAQSKFVKNLSEITPSGP